jgi:hypothetical protein
VVAKAPLSDAALEPGLLLQRLGCPGGLGASAPAVPPGDCRPADWRAVPGARARTRSGVQDANAPFAPRWIWSHPAIETAGDLCRHPIRRGREVLSAGAKADPKWAPAHVGMARDRDENSPAAAGRRHDALEIDPSRRGHLRSRSWISTTPGSTPRASGSTAC